MYHLQQSAGWSRSFPPHQKVPALRPGPAWAAPALPGQQGRLPGRQPRQTVFCPDSVLTEHRPQWRKGRLPQGQLGVCAPPQRPPCSGNERYARLWRSSFVLLATSPSPLILGEVTEVASSSGPPQPTPYPGQVRGTRRASVPYGKGIITWDTAGSWWLLGMRHIVRAP